MSTINNRLPVALFRVESFWRKDVSHRSSGRLRTSQLRPDPCNYSVEDNNDDYYYSDDYDAGDDDDIR